ncbi:hypothetical protein ACQP2F_29690 [Actinoplanes sp. CA-030573]|uniref:hypothetical protein n=1 Tax=Actinoplanes sp. CA-030573 TaxID=3239898 RepID=UPI003D8EBD72
MAVLLLVTGLTAACRVGDRDDCREGKLTPVTPGAVMPTPGSIDEALWVADERGSLRAIDGRSGRITATVVLGRAGDPPPAGHPFPPMLAAGGGRVYAYWPESGELAVVDAVAARVAGRMQVPGVRPYGGNLMFFAHGSLWIAQPGRLWRVRGTADALSTALPADFAPGSVTTSDHWLWLADGGTLIRINPDRPQDQQPSDLAKGVGQLASGIYATGVNSPEIRHLDPDDGHELGTVRLDDNEFALAIVGHGGQAWALGNCGNAMRLADRRRVRVSTVSQDLPAASAMGSLWVGDGVRSEVVRIDAATGAVLARLPVAAADADDPSFGLVAGRSTVWVLDGDFGGGVSRIDAAGGRVVRVLPGKPGSGALSAVVSLPPR